jgi:ankyrin repeat protein
LPKPKKTEAPTAKAPDISIHDAATDGAIKAVKQHLNAGADVNVKGGFADGTPLLYAAWEDIKEIVELLIAKGAGVNARDKDGETPVDIADNNEPLDILRKHEGKTSEELKAE